MYTLYMSKCLEGWVKNSIRLFFGTEPAYASCPLITPGLGDVLMVLVLRSPRRDFFVKYSIYS